MSEVKKFKNKEYRKSHVILWISTIVQGGIQMSIQNLINEFDQVKGRKPVTADELLDFIQMNYLRGTLSLNEYQTYFKELHAQGAKKPEYFSHEELKAF